MLINPEALQSRGPAITPLEKLFISETKISINDGFELTVQATGSPGKLQWSQREFHGEKSSHEVENATSYLAVVLK